MTTANAPRRAGSTGVHSVDRFVFSVPDVAEAKRFYSAFGLEVRSVGKRLDLYSVGNPHCWASVHESRKPKRLEYVRYGIYAEDRDAMSERIARHHE